jgi:hypothetical protein
MRLRRWIIRQGYTWQDSARQFLDNITRARSVFTSNCQSKQRSSSPLIMVADGMQLGSLEIL